MKNSIITDINLGSFKVSTDGKNIEFELLDMDQGENYGTLTCKNVYHFEYQNSFEEDDGFACYICEIYSFRLSNSEAISNLKNKKYRFLKDNKELGIPVIDIENVILESGEIFIDLYCESFEMNLS